MSVGERGAPEDFVYLPTCLVFSRAWIYLRQAFLELQGVCWKAC